MKRHEQHALRLRDRRREREGAPRARRLRFGRAALRPDERPHVRWGCTAPGRPTPCWSPTWAKAQRCSTSPAAPATSRWPSRPRSAPPGRWSTPTSTKPCCAPAATGCSMPAGAAHRGVRRREAAFPDNHFDVVTVAFGLRNMTHKDAALGNEPRAQARRQAAGARVLEGGQAAGRRPTTGTRSRCCRGWARPWPATTPATATWPNRSACTPARRSSRPS
jgi:hypothetical protein